MDIVQWLLNHEADVNAQNNEIWTLLHNDAAWHGRLEVFRILIEHDADINLRNTLGEFTNALNKQVLVTTVVTLILCNHCWIMAQTVMYRITMVLPLIVLEETGLC